MAFVENLIRKSVWQFLPVKFRRLLLSKSASYLAPRIEENPAPCFPIIVVGAFRSATGLGQSARLCYSALKAENIPVKAVDITTQLSQPVDMEFPVDYFDPDNPQGTVVLHVNAPLVPLTLLKLGKKFIRQKHVVGYWAWELPETPPDWKNGIEYVHQIWVPSQFTRDSLLQISQVRPITVIPHPVAHDFVDTTPKRNKKQFEFEALMVFNVASSFARKNPVAAIAAFKLAFGHDEKVRFTIKIINAEHYPAGVTLLNDSISEAPNIEVISSCLSSEEMNALYSRADVIVSLHRSEGFGLTIAEGMLYGKPVIATNWSGNVDFMDEQTALPISYDLVSASDAQHTYDYPEMHWANANVDEAVLALTKLRSDVKFRNTIGNAASKHARQMLSAKKYATTVLQTLGLEI